MQCISLVAPVLSTPRRKGSQGAKCFDLWAAGLQKRDARTSPQSELAPSGKVSLAGFDAATSGQIVVQASRLSVSRLCDSGPCRILRAVTIDKCQFSVYQRLVMISLRFWPHIAARFPGGTSQFCWLTLQAPPYEDLIKLMAARQFFRANQSRCR